MSIKSGQISGKNAYAAGLDNAQRSVQKRDTLEEFLADTADMVFPEIKIPKVFSMKFPKPKQLVENEYPDLDITQPKLIKHFVQKNCPP
jgi:hypothetical protein